MQQTASSFDHLIGTGEKRRRNFEVECLCCFDIYDQLKLRRLFHRQIRRLGPFQYLVHITRCAVEQARDIWRGIFRDGCCAWVPTGHNAKPVSAAMNSRLLMLSPCCGRQRRKRRSKLQLRWQATATVHIRRRLISPAASPRECEAAPRSAQLFDPQF
jgi:hypothetical protein